MAVLRPFRAIYPNPSLIDPTDFICNPEQFQSLIYPKPNPGERSKYVPYARSSGRLNQLLAENLLLKTESAFLIANSTHASFLLALIDLDEPLVRLSQTDLRTSVERNWLLEATNVQFQHGHALASPLEIAADPTKILFSATDPNGTTWEVLPYLTDSPLTTPDPAILVEGNEVLEGVIKRFVAKQKRRPSASNGAFLAAFPLNWNHKALVFRPIVVPKRSLGPEQLQSQLREHFALHEIQKDKLMARLATEQHSTTGIFGLSLPGGYTFVAQAKDIDRLAQELAADKASLSNSDILHRYVFEKLFGMTRMDVFTYARTAQEAFDRVDAGDYGFFLADSDLDSMEDMAIATGVFPPRSVDLKVSLPTGMAMWALTDYRA